MGFRYGSLVEDYNTGYMLQCEGWRSAFCHPERAAFLGDAPICLIDVVNQIKRWAVGLLEVGFSKFSPVTYGVRSMGLLMGLSYAHYAFWPMWSIPITIYAFLPQIALISGLSIFPKVCTTFMSFLTLGVQCSILGFAKQKKFARILQIQVESNTAGRHVPEGHFEAAWVRLFSYGVRFDSLILHVRLVLRVGSGPCPSIDDFYSCIEMVSTQQW